MSKQIQKPTRERTADEQDGSQPAGQAAGPGQESSAAEGPESTREEELSLDVVFEILKNSRRRLVMRELRGADDGTTLGDLAEHIGGIENDKPPSALDAQERKRVYVGLYQCHLPKMDDADVVEFDKDRGTVNAGPNAELVYEYLNEDAETEPPWERYYLSLAGASVAGYLGAAAFFEPLTTVVFLLSMAALICLATGHARHGSETFPEDSLPRLRSALGLQRENLDVD